MKKNELIQSLTITICAVLLHACSSESSSPSTTNTATANETAFSVDSSKLPKVSKKAFSLNQITEDNAESLAKAIHKFNSYWLHEMKHELESQDLENGNTLTSVSISERDANLDELCIRGGNYRVSIDGSSQYIAGDGYKAFAPGNIFNMSFTNCGAEFLRSGYYTSGTISSQIISGAYDGFDFLLEGTSVRTINQHRVLHGFLDLVEDETDYYEFLHGDRLLTLIDKNTLQSSGDFLTEKPISYEFNTPYQLHNYDFTLTKKPGRYSWDNDFELQTNKQIELDLNHLNGKYEIQYAENLIYVDYDDAFHSGVVSITGLNSALEIGYYETYLTYRVDEDLDGSYEVEAVLLYNEL